MRRIKGIHPHKKPCTDMYRFIEVMHDRENMKYAGGDFKCAATGIDSCECKCNRHPKCCVKADKLLSNNMVLGNRFVNVAQMQDCCNMCTNHPQCTAWEYDSEKVCVLKRGVVNPSSYIDNPYASSVKTWAGLPSGEGSCPSQVGPGTPPLAL